MVVFPVAFASTGVCRNKAFTILSFLRCCRRLQVDRFLLFRNYRLRATRNLFRAVTSELKGDASPICVSLQSPRAGGFRLILSHLPQRPTAALLSHADVDGESVHRALLAVQENDKLGSSSRACLLGAKERDRTLDRVVTLLGGSMSHFLPYGTGFKL